MTPRTSSLTWLECLSCGEMSGENKRSFSTLNFERVVNCRHVESGAPLSGKNHDFLAKRICQECPSQWWLDTLKDQLFSKSYACHKLSSERERSFSVFLMNKRGRVRERFSWGCMIYVFNIKKFWLNLWPKPCPHIPWVVLSYPRICATSSLVWSDNFGGVRSEMRRKLHGWVGFWCACQKTEEDWVFET